MMTRDPVLALLGLFGISLLIATPAIAGSCDAPQTNTEIAACLQTELRDSDLKINQTYQALMRQLDEAKKLDLRTEQRAWLKQRDTACQLDSKESDRERWMQAILKDYTKTVCVVRFTRSRVAELDRMLASRAAPASAPAPAPAPTPAPTTRPTLEDNDLYEVNASIRHSRGKWYCEFQINIGEIARTAETTLAIGFVNPGGGMAGRLVNIRRRDREMPIARLGLALDVDDGKVYSRANGNWIGGAPGSAQGLDVKLGREYGARVVSSVAMNELVDKQLIQINFGEKPFAYPMPSGYRPFSER
jgi:uncharacterized protein YecT (DUF1311 family)